MTLLVQVSGDKMRQYVHLWTLVNRIHDKICHLMYIIIFFHITVLFHKITKKKKICICLSVQMQNCISQYVQILMKITLKCEENSLLQGLLKLTAQ